MEKENRIIFGQSGRERERKFGKTVKQILDAVEAKIKESVTDNFLVARFTPTGGRWPSGTEVRCHIVSNYVHFGTPWRQAVIVGERPDLTRTDAEREFIIVNENLRDRFPYIWFTEKIVGEPGKEILEVFKVEDIETKRALAIILDEVQKLEPVTSKQNQ